MNIKDRYDALIVHFANKNKSAFAKKIKVSPTVLENIVGTRQTNPSFEVLQKTLFAFEEVNAAWLITGKGDMLIEKHDVTFSNPDFILALLKEKDKELTKMAKEVGSLQEQLKHLKSKIGYCGVNIAADSEQF
jgi:hypothetical protein